VEAAAARPPGLPVRWEFAAKLRRPDPIRVPPREEFQRFAKRLPVPAVAENRPPEHGNQIADQGNNSEHGGTGEISPAMGMIMNFE
jgi:hypothetical protein